MRTQRPSERITLRSLLNYILAGTASKGQVARYRKLLAERAREDEKRKAMRDFDTIGGKL